jgi:hypothetical protein
MKKLYYLLIAGSITTGYGLFQILHIFPYTFHFNTPFPFLHMYDVTENGAYSFTFDPIYGMTTDPFWFVWSLVLYFGISLLAIFGFKFVKQKIV